MEEMNSQFNVQETKKGKSKIGSIILILFSLPIILFGSMLRANQYYPYPLDANKIGHLLGGMIGSFLIALILAGVFFVIKRFIIKRKDNTFIKPFAIFLLIISILSVVGTLNG
jgi:hypothetical protein